MECILCAKDTGVGHSSSMSGVELETPSGGVIRVAGIGETASSSSAAVEGYLDNVGDRLACSVVTRGTGADHFEGEYPSEPEDLVLACLQSRCKGVGDATLPASSWSSVCGRSSSTGESDRGSSGSGSGSEGIVESFVSGVLKARKRCRNPTKRGVGVGESWESDG